MKKVFACLIVCLVITLGVSSCQYTDDLEELQIERSSSGDESTNTGENTGGGGPLNPPPAAE